MNRIVILLLMLLVMSGCVIRITPDGRFYDESKDYTSIHVDTPQMRVVW